MKTPPNKGAKMTGISETNAPLEDFAEVVRNVVLDAFLLNEEGRFNTPEEGADYALKCILRECGGEVVYIPKRKYKDLGERNRQIVAESTSKNQRELAKKYKLTTTQIYKILRDAKQ